MVRSDLRFASRADGSRERKSGGFNAGAKQIVRETQKLEHVPSHRIKVWSMKNRHLP